MKERTYRFEIMCITEQTKTKFGKSIAVSNQGLVFNKLFVIFGPVQSAIGITNYERTGSRA